MTRKIAPLPLSVVPESANSDLMAIRRDVLNAARQATTGEIAPIRAMARLVHLVEDRCRAEGIPAELMATQVVNRTIGDIDVRRIIEHDRQLDYRLLADELGVALPGERIAGTVASGERYLALRARMAQIERDLLDVGIDLHVYDLQGVGNPILRLWLSDHLAADWHIAVPLDQIFIANGSLDALDKAFRGLRATRWRGETEVIFPAPGFGVPEWEARSLGLIPVRIMTTPEAQYKLTPDQLRATLRAHPRARGLYVIISNNPSACSYQPDELTALLEVARDYPDLIILADMAYTGTGDLLEEQARVAALTNSEVAQRVITFWTLSKVYTMTGDRFGWMAIGDPNLARDLEVAFANTIASPSAEWQLRFMATFELLRAHPELRVKISALYRLRRQALIRQLQSLQASTPLFARIHPDDGGTVYVWCQLRPEVDVFELFAATGIAGVPGSAFGYADDHVRFSIGIVPVPGWETLTRARRGRTARTGGTHV